jgi:hypothetical protein
MCRDLWCREIIWCMRTVDRSFYVYVLFRLSGVPCYVGKGRKRRLLSHERLVRRGKPHANPHLALIIRNAGGSLPKFKIGESLTERAAFSMERRLIAQIGREVHGGPLVNLTDGGEGFAGGRFSEEGRKRLGVLHRGNTYGCRKHSPAEIANRVAKNTGQKRTPEQRARMSRGQLGNTNCRGYKHTEETKIKMRAAALGRIIPQKLRDINRARLLGKPGFFAGHKHSDETKAKMRKAWTHRTGHKHSAETKKKLRKAALRRARQ